MKDKRIGGAFTRVEVIKKMRDLLGVDLAASLHIVEAMEKNGVMDFSFLKVTKEPTLRQWYAGMALQGLLAATPPHSGHWPEGKAIAKTAYDYADAMIAAEATQAKE